MIRVLLRIALLALAVIAVPVTTAVASALSSQPQAPAPACACLKPFVCSPSPGPVDTATPITVNVRDFGAGDGGPDADDAPAFQAAGDRVACNPGGGTVMVPAGTYTFKTSYIGDGQSNVAFVGDSKGGSTIKADRSLDGSSRDCAHYPTNGDLFRFYNPSECRPPGAPYPGHITFSNLVFDMTDQQQRPRTPVDAGAVPNAEQGPVGGPDAGLPHFTLLGGKVTNPSTERVAVFLSGGAGVTTSLDDGLTWSQKNPTLLDAGASMTIRYLENTAPPAWTWYESPPLDLVNLSAIEFQNVDYAHVSHATVRKAFGNGIVWASLLPTDRPPASQQGDNIVFDHCARGILTSYEIAGAGMQGGALEGTSSFTNLTFIATGGTGIDMFLTSGTGSYASGPYVGSVSFQDIGPAVDDAGYPLIGVDDRGLPQRMNALHSDFGLQDTTFQDITSIDAGPHAFLGNMGQNFYDGDAGTPGPQNCWFDNISMSGYGSYPWPGQPQVPDAGLTTQADGGPPALHGGFVYNTSGMPIALQVTGAALIEVLAPLPIGSYVDTTRFLAPAACGDNHDTYAIPIGATVYIGYTGKMPSWTWSIAPNIFDAALTMVGGSVPGNPGTASANIVTWLDIQGAPGDGILLSDTSTSIFEDFALRGLGATRPAGAIQNLNTGLGAPSTNNVFQSGKTLSHIDGGTLWSDYYDDSLQASATISHVYLEAPVPPLLAIQEFVVGPGLGPCPDRLTVSGTLGPGSVLPTPAVPGSALKIPNNNPYDSPALVSIVGGGWTVVTCGTKYTPPSLVTLPAGGRYTLYYPDAGPLEWTWTTP
jgi:hypothetical protein